MIMINRSNLQITVCSLKSMYTANALLFYILKSYTKRWGEVKALGGNDNDKPAILEIVRTRM